MRTEPLQVRFERKFIPEPMSGCWLWLGAIGSSGYGWIGAGPGRKVLAAHRVSWELYRGPVNDLHVLHRCDNPCCVNPDHLFLGTHQENIADCKAKGRAIRARGAQASNAKLTEDQAHQIRRSRKKLREIAAEFDIGLPAVSAIRCGKTWKHLGGENFRKFSRKLRP